jgi:hypothetical protein
LINGVGRLKSCTCAAFDRPSSTIYRRAKIAPATSINGHARGARARPGRRYIIAAIYSNGGALGNESGHICCALAYGRLSANGPTCSGIIHRPPPGIVVEVMATLCLSGPAAEEFYVGKFKSSAASANAKHASLLHAA